MKRISLNVLVIIMVLGAGLQAGIALAQETPDQIYGRTPEDYIPYHRFSKPYKQFFLTPNEYLGYGRHLTEPTKIDSVRIGFLGPLEKTVSVATGGVSHEEGLGQRMLQGAQMALDEANARGGYRGSGTPYELIVRNDNGLWGASANEIVYLAYAANVWAVLGTIDGANSHIAIRTALKAELSIMNSGDTDPTYTETAIPWAFRCITDDRQMCYLLADYVFKTLKLTRVAALRANNRYGRIGIDEFRDAATRFGKPFVVEMNYLVGDTDFTSQLQRIKTLNPEAVMTYGDAEESALILNQMRSMGINAWFIGSDRMVTPEFVSQVKGNLDRVVAGYSYNPDHASAAAEAFRQNYMDRYGEMPETFAAHAYDGMSMIIQAVETGGLNRARIRDQLALMTTYDGVSGKKQFDPVFNNVGSTFLALGRNGKFVFLPEEEVRP